MSYKQAFAISLIVGLFVPLLVNGQVRISEVMYDPSGSDSKREWVEVYNAGSAAVDLATYFFLENNVYHKLVAQGNSILETGGYAIIVDSVPEVVADYPEYSGLMFDSAFSLGNTGETISMTNPQKENLHTFTYTADMGSAGNGNSLQINGTEVITAGPTLGAANKTQSEIPVATSTTTSSGTSTGQSSGSSSSTHSQQETVSNYVPSGLFKLGAGRDRMVTIHTPIEFEGLVSKQDMRPSMSWNMGDMRTRRGQVVTHIYENPGTYQVVLVANTTQQKAVSRIEVSVIEPILRIEQGTTTISIHNDSGEEVNLGGFLLVYLSRNKRIPDNTIIGSGDRITVPREMEDILTEIKYPNGVSLTELEIPTGLVDSLTKYCSQETLPLVCKGEKVRQFLVQ